MVRPFVFSLIAYALIGCTEESDPLVSQQSFTKIYDNNFFESSLSPIDVAQTDDGGYLLLGTRSIANTNFPGIYLMKTDALGNFDWEQEVDETYVSPVGLMESNNQFFFFAMSAIGLQTYLFSLQADGALGDPIAVAGSYPAAAAMDGDRFILLHYDHVTKNTVLSLVDQSGTVNNSKNFFIGAGDAVEEPIIRHFLRTGASLPFQVGKAPSGQYFFNGLYNYTLSLVFTEFVAEEPLAIVQGQQDDGGLTSFLPLDGNTFASARFNFDDNYFVPIASSPAGISSSNDLGGPLVRELPARAPVKIIGLDLEGESYNIFGSHTRSGQIVLYAYRQSTGELRGTHYLGFGNPFEFSNFSTTTDGGLVICGTTYLAGRFPRICLFKLSAAELASAF